MGWLTCVYLRVGLVDPVRRRFAGRRFAGRRFLQPKFLRRALPAWRNDGEPARLHHSSRVSLLAYHGGGGPGTRSSRAS